MDNQRIVALLVLILAGFGLWLQSQDRFIPFLEAMFGGGGGGLLPTSTTGTAGGVNPYPVITVVPIAPGAPVTVPSTGTAPKHPNGWGFGPGTVGPLPGFPPTMTDYTA